MADGFRGRGRGRALQAPKRQIANDGFGGRFFGEAFGVSLTLSAIGTVAAEILVPALTLVRTRGRISLFVRVSGAATNTFHGAFGLMIVSKEASLAGIASISTPLDDIERTWFVWQPITMYAVPAGSQTVTQAGYFTAEIDSRGQRKMKAGDVTVAVLELIQGTATTGTIIDGTYEFRQQFKL